MDTRRIPLRGITAKIVETSTEKTISSDYGESEIAVPRDRNGEFEPKVIEKRQTRTDEV